METRAVDKDKDLAARYKDVRVIREGTQLILPTDMPTQDAIDWLSRKLAEEEQTVAIHEVIDSYPLEGAYALARALEEKYGFTSLVKTPHFFGDIVPSMIGVEVDIGRTVQVPWGRMRIPNVSGFIQTGASYKDHRWVFSLNGEVKRKDEREINALANMVRTLLKERSIYRGKALNVNLSAEDPERFNITAGPKFKDVTKVRPSELIFADDVMQQVKVNLFTPVERTKECREYRVPIKRGVLMEGPYGTGKTLTADVVAKKCVENGWTFIYLDDASKLPQALAFARQYQPCAVFAEDIDSVVAGKRSVDMNSILNTIDGVESKGTEILVVLTTNDVDSIHKAMLRPGRLDAVISVRPPDAKAVAQLIELYGRGLIAPGEDMLPVGEKLAGRIPAVIREVVERAKLDAISRLAPDEQLSLKTVDLLSSADGMLAHLKLLEEPEDDFPSPMEEFAEVIGEYLERGVNEAIAQSVDKHGQKALDRHKGSNGHSATAPAAPSSSG